MRRFYGPERTLTLATRRAAQCRCVEGAADPAAHSLRIVIPAYNESHRIVRTLRDYCTHFGDRATIAVVANGCTDDTSDVVAALSAEFANLQLVEVAGKIGKGGAIRAGFKVGREEFVGFADADGSTSAQEYDRLWTRLRNEDACGVIGSRWLRGAVVSPPQPPLRLAASRVLNLIVRAFFGLPYSDTQCGAKVFRRPAIDGVLYQLQLANFAFDIDLLWKLHLRGCHVIEMPTKWRDREGSTLKLAGASKSMLSALVRLRLQDSIVRHLPFFEYFARDAVMPVKRSASVLILADREGDGLDGATAALIAAFVREWEARGNETRYYGANPTQPLLARLASRVAFLVRYALIECRRCEALVEVESGLPFIVPAFSAKPGYVVSPSDAAPGPLRGLYRRLYDRVTRLRPVAGRERAARELAVSMVETIEAVSGIYQSGFRRTSDRWNIDFTEVDSGTRRTQLL